jgi:4-carboxymuconolactone decarboxylase
MSATSFSKDQIESRGSPLQRRPERKSFAANGGESASTNGAGSAPPRARTRVRRLREGPTSIDAPAPTASPEPDALDSRTGTLASVHALAVLGNDRDLRRFVGLALDDGIDPRSLREALLQSILFAGIPRAINAFAALRDEMRARGIDDAAPEEPASVPPDPRETRLWARRGRDLFRAIYPRNHREVAADLERHHPELSRNVLFCAYGQVLSRDVLPPRERELLAVAALVVLETPRQLVAHIRGARWVGASVDEIRRVIERMAMHAPRDVVQRALLYFDRLKREL